MSQLTKEEEQVAPGLLLIGRISHGESATSYFTLARSIPELKYAFPTRGSVEQWLASDCSPLKWSHCSCAHDCCGCWNTYEPEVIAYDRIHQNWIITQTGRRNV